MVKCINCNQQMVEDDKVMDPDYSYFSCVRCDNIVRIKIKDMLEYINTIIIW